MGRNVVAGLLLSAVVLTGSGSSLIWAQSSSDDGNTSVQSVAPELKSLTTVAGMGISPASIEVPRPPAVGTVAPATNIPSARVASPAVETSFNRAPMDENLLFLDTEFSFPESCPNISVAAGGKTKAGSEPSEGKAVDSPQTHTHRFSLPKEREARRLNVSPSDKKELWDFFADDIYGLWFVKVDGHGSLKIKDAKDCEPESSFSTRHYNADRATGQPARDVPVQVWSGKIKAYDQAPWNAYNKASPEKQALMIKLWLEARVDAAIKVGSQADLLQVYAKDIDQALMGIDALGDLYPRDSNEIIQGAQAIHIGTRNTNASHRAVLGLGAGPDGLYAKFWEIFVTLFPERDLVFRKYACAREAERIGRQALEKASKSYKNTKGDEPSKIQRGLEEAGWAAERRNVDRVVMGARAGFCRALRAASINSAKANLEEAQRRLLPGNQDAQTPAASGVAAAGVVSQNPK